MSYVCCSEEQFDIYDSYNSCSRANRLKGGYCLVMSLNSETHLKTKGRTFSLTPGTYIYCGSALNSLDARVERHIRNFKGERIKRFWHIDYLLPFSKPLGVVEATASFNIECKLVSSLTSIGLKPIPGFGSSDCRSGCKGHLLHAGGSFTSATQQAVLSFKQLGLSPEVLKLKTPRPL